MTAEDSDATPARAPRMPGPQRRAALLSAARDRFARHGFHGAATADIARGAGCSEAVLYRHFPSKRDLLVAVLKNEIETRLAAGRGFVPPPGADPVAGLPDILAARLAEPEMVTTIRLVLLAIGMADDPEVGAAVRASFATVRGSMVEAMRAGQAAGGLRADLDPDLAAWLWHGLFMVAAVRNSAGDDDVAMGAVEAGRLLGRLLSP
ncbi:MAG: TetR/AcrR family transcriptional regulator [Thermoleophilia bacterium]